MTTTALPKGRRTRDAVLTRGVELACRVGLGGLTIGGLADEVGMSKSGMYAHFGSKQALYHAVLEAALTPFANRVIAAATSGGMSPSTRTAQAVGSTRRV